VQDARAERGRAGWALKRGRHHAGAAAGPSGAAQRGVVSTDPGGLRLSAGSSTIV
jgi:hypothetical protein